MASSGIPLDEAVQETATKFKLRQVVGFVLEFEGDKKVTLRKGSVLEDPPVMEWLVEQCRDDAVCWAVVNFGFHKGTDNDVFTMIRWAPEGANVKMKMLLSSTADAVKRKLSMWVDGLQLASIFDKGDLCRENIINTFKKLKGCEDFDMPRKKVVKDSGHEDH